MAVARLPAGIEPLHLHTTLFNQFRIEIPCYNWAGQNLIRLSIQGYNDAQDIARLIAALQALLPG
jgi:isopenicillin-N epimerase